MRQLPAPAVEQLLSMEPGEAIVGACPVGDALMGTALMAATSDGKLHCLWPSGAKRSELVRVHDCEILSEPRYVPCGLTRCFFSGPHNQGDQFSCHAAGGWGREHRQRGRRGQH